MGLFLFWACVALATYFFLLDSVTGNAPNQSEKLKVATRILLWTAVLAGPIFWAVWFWLGIVWPAAKRGQKKRYD